MFDELVEDGRESAAGRIAHETHTLAKLGDGLNQAMDRSGVTLGPMFDFNTVPGGQHRHTVIGDGAANQYDVTVTDTLRFGLQAGDGFANSGRIDIETIAGPALHDLGVAGDDRNLAVIGGGLDAVENPSQGVQW